MALSRAFMRRAMDWWVCCVAVAVGAECAAAVPHIIIISENKIKGAGNVFMALFHSANLQIFGQICKTRSCPGHLLDALCARRRHERRNW